MDGNQRVVSRRSGSGWVFIIGLVVIVAAAGLLARFLLSKPQPKKIGILQVTSILDSVPDGMKKGMSDLGYVEGKDVVYEYADWEQDPSKVQGIIQKYIAENVDVIFVI